MRNDPANCVASLEARPFDPRPELGAQLLTGALAALAAGSLAVASSCVDVAQPGARGLTVAHGLAWAALVPLFLVLRAYLGLARATDSAGLRKSSQCLFGAILLFTVLDLAMVDTLPVGGRIMAWVVFGFGLLALLAAPFVPVSKTIEMPAEAEAPSSSDTRTNWIIVGAVLVILAKLVVKGLFGKGVLIQWLRELDGAWEVLAIGVLTLLLAAFVIWFGVTKIRLRGPLGGVAALVGCVEVLLVVALAGMVVWLVAVVSSAVANQPAMTEEVLEALVNRTGQPLALAGIAATLVWSSLTALLFGAVRSRMTSGGQEVNAGI
jgi:hypothetical protein